jgi:CRP/FNR family cyclic AMP-dependent transcriptional regulator
VTENDQATFDPKAFLSTGNHGRTVLRYAKGEPVFLQGGKADAAYYILKGRVKISASSPQGKEAVVALLGPGEFFGEGCLVGSQQRPATARAMIDSEVTRIGRSELTRVLNDEPAFSELFMQHLLTRNRRVEEDLIDQLFNSSEKRLARTLLLLANFGKGSDPQLIPTKITHETLAEIVGTTRPRISQFMAKFRERGFIDYNGHLKVNSSLLSVLLND